MWTLINYTLKRDAVPANLELLRGVYTELESTRPGGVRYATFQLSNEASFLALVDSDDPGRFSQLEAFRAYRSTLDERCVKAPVVTELHPVGAYRLP